MTFSSNCFRVFCAILAVQAYLALAERNKTINVTDLFPNSSYESYVGYIPVGKNDSYIFYQLFSAFNTTIGDTSKPLILWMQGGPGCSGLIGAYLEMGPFFIKNVTVFDNKTNTSTTTQQPVANDWAWTKDNHMVFIDSPIGVGFSINGTMQPNDTVEAAPDFEKFLIGFFQVYPQFKNTNFYIFTESYGGHYGPAFTAQVVANKATNNITITGLGVGNGLVDPKTQSTSWASKTFSAGLISSSRRNIYKRFESDIAQNVVGDRNLYQATMDFLVISGDEAEGGTLPPKDSIPVVTGLSSPVNFVNYDNPIAGEAPFAVWLQSKINSALQTELY